MIAEVHHKRLPATARFHAIEHIAAYLTGSGPTRYWAVCRYLSEIGITISEDAVERACEHFPETFLSDRDHVGKLIGIRTSAWLAEVSTRRSFSASASIKEQRLPRLRRTGFEFTGR